MIVDAKLAKLEKNNQVQVQQKLIVFVFELTITRYDHHRYNKIE